MESQEVPGVEIPEPAMNHPVTVYAFIVLILLIVAAAARKHAAAVFAPVWRWITGRDSRAYRALVKELELVQRQLEASRQERRVADERHSREIAELRDRYETDMRLLSETLADTQRQLAELLAGVNATRSAVEANEEVRE